MAAKETVLQIRCSAAWKERLRTAAAEEEREMADVIREAVSQWLDRRQRRQGKPAPKE